MILGKSVVSMYSTLMSHEFEHTRIAKRRPEF